GRTAVMERVCEAREKYLAVSSSTDGGPANQGCAQPNADERARRSLWLVVLKKGVPSPLARESDEEKPADDKPKDAADEPKETKEKEPPKDDKSKDKKKPKTQPAVIDFD